MICWAKSSILRIWIPCATAWWMKAESFCWKTAIIRWTRAFGNRYGHNGIVINGIAPGATLTDMIASYAKSADQPYPRHALERFILPEEIAELAAYLLSKPGEIVCGHTVVADAGDNNAVY